ncbi:MAG: hypothetical protein KAF41_12620, partial [Flavobacterium sp.]|nr:hypothetical protein [Flavobacterium sp.]
PPPPPLPCFVLFFLPFPTKKTPQKLFNKNPPPPKKGVLPPPKTGKKNLRFYLETPPKFKKKILKKIKNIKKKKIKKKKINCGNK